MAAAASSLASGAESPSGPVWTPIRWHGEDARELVTTRWRAVVSIERARLVHFGPAGHDDNLLFVTETKDDPQGWSGHRVWLGPQMSWDAVWPPPVAWEASAAETVTSAGVRLALDLPDAGGGWARLTRVYELDGDRLVCRVVVHAGGTRAAQVMQIFQVPTPERLEVAVHPDAAYPQGFVLLCPANNRPETIPAIELPAQATRTAPGRLALHQTDGIEKLGFPEQDLVALRGGWRLVIGREATEGTMAGLCDFGFNSQVYLGAASYPVIELEQMSPRYAAGAAAQHTVMLDLGQVE